MLQRSIIGGYRSVAFRRAWPVASVRHGRFMSTGDQDQSVIYRGPFANVAKKLKIFSVTSLGLSAGISPFVFVIDVPVPTVARVALVGAALATSGASTGLIQWVLSPYVTRIEARSTEPATLDIHTLSFFGKDHRTTVPAEAIQPSTRPFTTWMVADSSEASGAIGNKPAKPKMLFYVHPELWTDAESTTKITTPTQHQ